MPKSGKKVIHFHINQEKTGKLDSVVQFLEKVQKQISYINLNVEVTGTKTIKVTLFGPRDLQHLASDRLRDLAQKFL